MALRLIVLLLLAGPAASARVQVVATTSLVADLVREVAGEHVQVESLMGAGVDPHLFKPTARDILRLQRARVIFYNGLMLEGKMGEVLERLGRVGKRVQAVTAAIPVSALLSPEEFEGNPDPHVWFDVMLWRSCVGVVEQALAAVDPANTQAYAANASAYRARLEELHAWALAKAAELPPERRVLVTSHDAYNYFGRAYGFTVVGLQGISTVTEAGLADVTKLADFIKQRSLKAIFVETSVPHATIARVARDSGARIGGELFSDALGASGQIVHGVDVGTYEGMFRHNLITIVEALK
jgi:manganese/zinc/iron transport system substrate-binding protein